MDKARRKRLSQAEIDSLVQETVSKVVPRTAVTASTTVTLPKPPKAVSAPQDSPPPIRPLTTAFEDSLASIQATILRIDERLTKTESAFGGFEKQINTVETSLVAERQAREEQARVIGEVKAIAESVQNDDIRAKLTNLTERLDKIEQSLSRFEKQANDIWASLSADREAREEHSRIMNEMKTTVEELQSQPARSQPSEPIQTAELAGLTERLANVESATDRFEQYKKSLEAALMANRQLQLAQSQAINTQLKTITQGLRNTLGYDIKKNFRCDCCGADGAVALKIRCTLCEKENWWGWWPKEKS